MGRLASRNAPFGEPEWAVLKNGVGKFGKWSGKVLKMEGPGQGGAAVKWPLRNGQSVTMNDEPRVSVFIHSWLSLLCEGSRL